ncbi:MAG: membrane protein insertase YidC, partial [Chthoniobacterales bacterium]
SVTYFPPPVVPPTVAVASPTPASPEATATPASSPVAAVDTPSIAPKEDRLYTSSAEYTFENDKGGVEQVLLYSHRGEQSHNVLLNEKGTAPIGTINFEGGDTLKGFAMQSDSAKGDVVFKTTTKDGIEITKRFHLPDNISPNAQYLIGMEVSFRNPTPAKVDFPAYSISAGRAVPIHLSDIPLYTRFDWLRDGKMTNIDVNWFTGSKIPLIGYQISAPNSLYTAKADKITWAAVSSQYFCTIICALDSGGAQVWAKRFLVREEDNKQIYGIEGALGFSAFSLAPQEEITRKLTVYAGPKDYTILQKFGEGQQDIMKYGWFKFVSVFLLKSMNWLYGKLGNYAWAIIVLTLCIKTVMWPLQNKATQSMKKMSALSPKMTELREKYKDDPTKMNEELMKLYREYNVNPFSGCLPMLIQIPIFFGFYSMLGTSIELRNSSFLWIHDLSQPDTVFHISGFPINILPLIMAGTMIWQMTLTPKSGDATQQRFMFFMPVIFIVFCYNYASALALYWTTQNIFSIVQLYFTRNAPLPTLEKKSDVTRRQALEEKKKRKQRKL